jgi:hypothetical protein
MKGFSTRRIEYIRIGFLVIDVFCDLQMDCVVGFMQRRIAGTGHKNLYLRDIDPRS